jgi:hypothetical protein
MGDRNCSTCGADLYWAYQLQHNGKPLCRSCYEEQTGDILARYQPSAATDSDSSPIEACVAGGLLGALMGFVFRPTVLGAGVPFVTVLLRGATLQGTDVVWKPLAVKSFNYMLLGTVVGALAGYALMMLSRLAKRSEAGATADVVQGVPSLPPAETRAERDCPWCAERILAKAQFCKHCRRDVTGADSPPDPMMIGG